MFAGHRKLDNLLVIVDNNNLQIDGTVEDVCSPYPIDKKFEAFNFHVINIDGNDFDQIDAAFKAAQATGRVFTVEEHSIIGGLGSAVMECLAEKNPVKVTRIGVRDTFGESGPAKDLLHKYELDAEGIYKQIKASL